MTTLLAIQTTPLLNELRMALLVLLIVSALAECFLGYVLFRLVLVVLGLLGGVLLGTAIASWLRVVPTGLDYFVACFTCAVICALLAWFLYRLAFAACAAMGVAALIAVVALGKQGSGGAWVFGGVTGVVVGIYAFIYTRRVFIFLSSLSGSFITVFTAAALIAGPAEGQQAAHVLPEQRWVIVVLSLISLALAGAGMYVQTKLSQSVRLVLMPQDEVPGRGGRGKVGRRSRASTQVRPRFTRV